MIDTKKRLLDALQRGDSLSLLVPMLNLSHLLPSSRLLMPVQGIPAVFNDFYLLLSYYAFVWRRFAASPLEWGSLAAMKIILGCTFESINSQFLQAINLLSNVSHGIMNVK